MNNTTYSMLWDTCIIDSETDDIVLKLIKLKESDSTLGEYAAVDIVTKTYSPIFHQMVRLTLHEFLKSRRGQALFHKYM